MLKIAICDDEKIFAEKIKELLEVYLDSKHIAREINIYIHPGLILLHWVRM